MVQSVLPAQDVHARTSFPFCSLAITDQFKKNKKQKTNCTLLSLN